MRLQISGLQELELCCRSCLRLRPEQGDHNLTDKVYIWGLVPMDESGKLLLACRALLQTILQEDP